MKNKSRSKNRPRHNKGGSLIRITTSTQDLGEHLLTEFFEIVKENEPLFKKAASIEELLSAKKFSKPDTLKVARFCALGLELFNCAERFYKVHRSKQGLSHLAKMFLSFPGSKKNFDHLIGKFNLEMVFTAHPTEVFPLPVLKILNRIETRIVRLFGSKSPESTHRNLQEFRADLTSLWLTDEIHREKPSVEQEADRLFYIFESSLWKSTPYFFRHYYLEYKKHFGSSPKAYPKLTLSSWIGGDRDGNPFVTAEATEKIIVKSRRRTLRLILLELYKLREEILIKSKQPKLIKLFPDARLPYKALFIELVERIQKALADQATLDVTSLEKHIVSRLSLAYTLLCQDGAKRLADRRLRSLMDRLRTFGLTPLKLDLRQDSEVHTQILTELKSKLKTLTPKAFKALDLLQLSQEAQEFFKTLQLASKFKPCPFQVYIISMAQTVEDLENLNTLLKLVETSQIPVAPLFETPDDIRRSLKILKSSQSKGILPAQIMWGYSDSTKKGGRLASAWNLFQAQQKVEKHFPNLVHFHGRGGSIARGGGDLEEVFQLLPSRLVGHHFRQTFQGEVIQDEFGLPHRSVLSFSALLKNCIANHFKTNQPEKRSKQITQLSQKAEAVFLEGFYQNTKINKLFKEHSPIDIINSLNLGSRPSKRPSAQDTLKGVPYRAIPWVFAWAQTRGLLPVWYGLQGLERDLLKIAKTSDFMSAFLKLVQKGLSFADSHILKTYMGPESKELQQQLDSVKNKLGVFTHPDLTLKEQLAQGLHSIQIQSLKLKEKTALDWEIAQIATQGIANYLGKTG